MTSTNALSDEPPGVYICDGGQPLWPVRWAPWRHGTYSYRVTAIGKDGAVLPGAIVAFSQSYRIDYAEYGQPKRLCIDGQEYRRRQRARVKRR